MTVSAVCVAPICQCCHGALLPASAVIEDGARSCGCIMFYSYYRCICLDLLH